MERTEQSVDWSDASAIERLLASEGLGDIDQQHQGFSDDAIIAHYAEATAGVALEVQTVRDTLDRYSGDMVGAAIASHFTGALVAELPLNGSVGEQEAGVVDDVTAKILKSGLSGVTLNDTARYFGINFELGGLHGLIELRDILDGISSDDIAELTVGMHIEDEIEEEILFDDKLDDLEAEQGNEVVEDDTEDTTEDDEEYEF